MSTPPHARVGNTEAGFEFQVDLSQALVSLRLWGFWTEQVWDRFPVSFADGLAAVPGLGIGVLVDLTQFAPQKDEAQLAIVDGLRTIPPRKTRAVAFIAQNPLMRLQIRRLIVESKAVGCTVHNSEREAREALGKTVR